MNSKKAITLLVLATMLLALVPIVPVQALAVPTLKNKAGNVVAAGVYDETVIVTGAVNDVPAGTVVELYWDDTTIAWNGVKGRLNSTTSDSDGNYEIWFNVPEAKLGNHFIWVKAVATGETKGSAAFAVGPTVDGSSSSGLRGDKVDVKVWGQKAEKDIALFLVRNADYAAGTVAGWQWSAAEVDTVTFTAGEDEYDGTAEEYPVRPGSFTLTDGVEAFVDNGDGTLTGAATGTGTINYVTGEWEVDFAVAPAANIVFTYDAYTADVADSLYLLSGSGETSALGSYTKKITLPNVGGTNPVNGVYHIHTLDAKGNFNATAFTVGAVITVSPDSGATGDIVTVKGRGFTAGNRIVYGAAPAVGTAGIALSGTACLVDDYPDAAGAVGVLVDVDGEFTMNVFIPEKGDEDDYKMQIGDGVLFADADFEVTELSEITVTPDYGPQGQTISIEGVNFPNKKDTTINVVLDPAAGADVAIKTFDVNADGSFSGTFRVPAEVDGTYDIKAFWANTLTAGGVATGLAGNNIEATSTFRIGSVLVLLSDDEGPAGLQVTLSGNGFTATKGWNATFGDETIFENEVVAAGGLLKQGVGAAIFYVPQVEPGVYDIMVLDEDTGISVVTQFTVTEATTFEWDPMEAPSGYNVTLIGKNWSEDQGEDFDFWLFNSTDEWELDADVKTGGAAPAINFQTGLPDGDHDGDWEAWWVAEKPNGDELDKGTYTLNITYGDDFFMQVPFSIGDVHSMIAPRKAVFKIGDTVSFNLEHSFGNVATGTINSGEVKIYDPSGNLYWQTDLLVDWTKSGMYYYVPAADQLENGNPLVLLDDAPLGEWTFKWYENDGAGALSGDSDLIEEGTFMVEASASDVVSGQVADLANQIDELTADLSGVTEDFDDVKSDISGVLAVAQQAVAAANAATEAVNAVATQANNAGAAAEAAQVAAENAAEAASGLTTLVYGAIGAALVAALAAIVSLMQISRRIAG